VYFLNQYPNNDKNKVTIVCEFGKSTVFNNNGADCSDLSIALVL